MRGMRILYTRTPCVEILGKSMPFTSTVTRDIMRHMLSKRADLRADIIQCGGRGGVMAVSE